MLISEKSEVFPHVPYELSFHGDKTYEKIYLCIDLVQPAILLYDNVLEVVVSILGFCNIKQYPKPRNYCKTNNSKDSFNVLVHCIVRITVTIVFGIIIINFKTDRWKSQRKS